MSATSFNVCSPNRVTYETIYKLFSSLLKKHGTSYIKYIQIYLTITMDIDKRKRSGITEVIKRVRNSKWKWVGHRTRSCDNKWTKLVTEWIPNRSGTIIPQTLVI